MSNSTDAANPVKVAARSMSGELDCFPDSPNPIFAAAYALIAAHNTHDDNAEEASVAAYEELPFLHGPARSWEGCAAFGMAIFGPEVVPQVTPDNGEIDTYGVESQIAFQIAKVYLTAPLNSPARAALQTLAVVIQRSLEADAPEGEGRNENC